MNEFIALSQTDLGSAGLVFNLYILMLYGSEFKFLYQTSKLSSPNSVFMPLRDFLVN